MATTFEKLNFKGHNPIAVINAPESFEAELATLGGTKILRKVTAGAEVPFWLAFVTKQAEVDRLARLAAEAAKGDAVVWFAYPKGTSKRYKSEISRDNGWQVLGELGFEPVRAVAIDEDWSGMRFRRVEFIKTMKRSPEHRMTAEGKARS
jgi:hypothetical protein